MGAATTTVSPVGLSHESWAPFGWLPVDDTDPRDPLHDLEFAWGDPHLNVIGHDLAEVVATGRGLRCDEMFRHDTHTQALTPLDAEAVVLVAPAHVPLSDPGQADHVRAFLMRPLETVVLHRGTWHWGPYPVGRSRVRILNVQGRRYLEDNHRVDLAALGAPVEVVLSQYGQDVRGTGRR